MNLSKSFKVIACIVLLASMMSGCVKSVHLKDLMVVEALAVDKGEDNVNITAQTLKLNMSSGGQNGNAPQGGMTMNTDEQGNSISDAVANLSENLSKKAFFGQNKLFVLGSDFCSDELKNEMDYFIRSSDVRADMAVCIADGTAKSVIESKENDTDIPAENMVNLMKIGEEAGTSAYVTAGDLLNMNADKTTDIYLPVLKKNKDRDNVTAQGIGLFSHGRLVYVTDKEETLGFLLASGKTKNCTLSFEAPELGKVGVELSDTRVKKKMKIEDGNMIFEVKIESQFIINEIENGMTKKIDDNALEQIHRYAEKELEALCRKGFYACQSHGSDALRTGEYLAKDSYESYKKLSDDWNTYYQTVKISPSAKVKLKKFGDNTQLS